MVPLDAGWAAILGALVGVLASPLAIWLQSLLTASAERRNARYAAYTKLLTATILAFHLADTMRLIVDSKPSVLSAVSDFFGGSKQLSNMDVYEWLRREFLPVYEAHSEIFIVGSPRAMKLADDLLRACGEVLKISTARTAAKEQDLKAAVSELSRLRREMAVVARKDCGQRVVDLASESKPEDGVAQLGA